MTKVKKDSKDVESQLKVVLEAPRYKMIPVDQQTYERLVVLCQAQGRKQGAKVKLWVDSEYEEFLKVEGEVEKQGSSSLVSITLPDPKIN